MAKNLNYSRWGLPRRISEGELRREYTSVCGLSLDTPEEQREKQKKADELERARQAKQSPAQKAHRRKWAIIRRLKAERRDARKSARLARLRNPLSHKEYNAMGDAAEDAADMAEEQYFEYLNDRIQAAKLTDSELVGQVEAHYEDAGEPMSTWEALDEKQAKMAVGICKWFHDKSFLTLRQREALISIVAMLWTE